MSILEIQMNILSRQTHRIAIALTMLAATAFAGAGEQEPGVTVEPVRVEKIADLPGNVLTVATVTYAAGAESSAHHHSGSVFAYVLSGAIRSENCATGPVKIYKAGESFFEPLGSKHVISENASATEPAKLLVTHISKEGAEMTTFEPAPSASALKSTPAHEKEVKDAPLRP